MYAALHDSALDRTESGRRHIHSLLEGDDLKALRILEKISALRPPVSDAVQNELTQFTSGIFTCASPSRNSIEEQLRRGPVHECGLSFQNVSEHVKAAEAAANKGAALFDLAFSRKMEVFMNQTVRQRLRQGESDLVIAGILGCKDGSELRAHLTRSVLRDPSVVETINRYLKRISVRRVRIGDFKPTLGTIEKDQIAAVAKEFHEYLEEKIKSIEGDENTLPMLQLD